MIDLPISILIDAARRVALKHQAALDDLPENAPWQERFAVETRVKTSIIILDTMEQEHERLRGHTD